MNQMAVPIQYTHRLLQATNRCVLVWAGERVWSVVRWVVYYGRGDTRVVDDGGGHGVTAEVKGGSPSGTAGDRGVCGHRTCLQVCQYNDSLNIPHSTLTDHYYRLPSFVSVTILEYTEVATLRGGGSTRR